MLSFPQIRFIISNQDDFNESLERLLNKSSRFLTLYLYNNSSVNSTTANTAKNGHKSVSK